MKNIIRNLGQGLLVVLIAVLVTISFFTLYDILDYFNIGADGS